MKELNLILEVSKIVEDACKKETNAYGYGIWSSHIVFVVKYSKELAKKLYADEEIVELAALLHDLAGIKDSSLTEQHHIHGGNEAEKILNTYNYPKEKIEHIKECIFSHRGSIQSRRLTPEAECIASADAMAHISQVPSLLYLTYTQHGMNIDEGTKWVSDKIDRSWNKLCPEAKEIIKEQYYSAKRVLNQSY